MHFRQLECYQHEVQWKWIKQVAAWLVLGKQKLPELLAAASVAQK